MPIVLPGGREKTESGAHSNPPSPRDNLLLSGVKCSLPACSGNRFPWGGMEYDFPDFCCDQSASHGRVRIPLRKRLLPLTERRHPRPPQILVCKPGEPLNVRGYPLSRPSSTESFTHRSHNSCAHVDAGTDSPTRKWTPGRTLPMSPKLATAERSDRLRHERSECSASARRPNRPRRLEVICDTDSLVRLRRQVNGHAAVPGVMGGLSMPATSRQSSRMQLHFWCWEPGDFVAARRGSLIPEVPEMPADPSLPDPVHWSVTGPAEE